MANRWTRIGYWRTREREIITYAAYFSSLTFVAVRELFSVHDRLILFIYFLLSMLLGGSVVPYSNLPLITKEYIFHYNGGFFPMYFYFYLGWIGVILSGIIISIIVNKSQKLNSETTDFSKLLLVSIISTTPRWYLYSPSPIFRGTLLFIICYFLFFLINKSLGKLSVPTHK